LSDTILLYETYGYSSLLGLRCILRAIGTYLIFIEFLLVMGKETSSPSLLK